MATRSRIGIELPDGSILSAYHHWDGYPEWLGKILNTHYYDRFKAFDLIGGGDMSCCWTKERWNDSTNESYGAQYYSQRGEDCPPRHDADLCEYLLAINAEEYHYLFRNGEWICYDMHPLGTELPTIVEIPKEAMAV